MCGDHSYEKSDLGEGDAIADRTNGRSVPICISRRRQGASLFQESEEEQQVCMDKQV